MLDGTKEQPTSVPKAREQSRVTSGRQPFCQSPCACVPRATHLGDEEMAAAQCVSQAMVPTHIHRRCSFGQIAIVHAATTCPTSRDLCRMANYAAQERFHRDSQTRPLIDSA